LLRSRELSWDGCCNVRDLGGLPTEDGRQTRFGVVVRSDDIQLLSEQGWRSLAAYGISRIVDLRHEHPPYPSPVETIRVPLLDPPSIDEVDELLAGVDDPVAWRRENYLFFLDRFQPNFARAFGAVAAPTDGTVLVHCAGGVDRTGLIAAMLLRTAGVGIDAIADDYAASEANWAPSARDWLDEAPDETERRKRRLLIVIPAAAMREVIVELERRYGSVSAYLAGGGVADEDLARIRERLRG
jgi:protein-tyrosine phosphatase